MPFRPHLRPVSLRLSTSSCPCTDFPANYANPPLYCSLQNALGELLKPLIQRFAVLTSSTPASLPDHCAQVSNVTPLCLRTPWIDAAPSTFPTCVPHEFGNLVLLVARLLCLDIKKQFAAPTWIAHRKHNGDRSQRRPRTTVPTSSLCIECVNMVPPRAGPPLQFAKFLRFMYRAR